jgi:16S rRNA (guanine966-N2)-methyltransferase
MRIVAGQLGGRTFDSPSGHHTHPMGERVRGALFNTLGDITGLMVLDAFAGSGGLGFEAISRGAGHVVAIEPDRLAQRAIAENTSRLAIADRVKLVRAKAQSWLSTTQESFDIVLCDPPYGNVNEELLKDLSDRTKPGGITVFSLPPGYDPGIGTSYKLLQKKDYGDAVLFFFRRET